MSVVWGRVTDSRRRKDAETQRIRISKLHFSAPLRLCVSAVYLVLRDILIGEDDFAGAGLEGKGEIQFQGFVVAQGVDAGEVEILKGSVAIEIFATDVAAGEGV